MICLTFRHRTSQQGLRSLDLIRILRHWKGSTTAIRPASYELSFELGRLGFLGAYLEGYGCAGMSNLEYGLIMQELERGDVEIRRCEPRGHTYRMSR